MFTKSAHRILLDADVTEAAAKNTSAQDELNDANESVKAATNKVKAAAKHLKSVDGVIATAKRKLSGGTTPGEVNTAHLELKLATEDELTASAKAAKLKIVAAGTKVKLNIATNLVINEKSKTFVGVTFAVIALVVAVNVFSGPSEEELNEIVAAAEATTAKELAKELMHKEEQAGRDEVLAVYRDAVNKLDFTYIPGIVTTVDHGTMLTISLSSANVSDSAYAHHATYSCSIINTGKFSNVNTVHMVSAGGVSSATFKVIKVNGFTGTKACPGITAANDADDLVTLASMYREYLTIER